MSTAKTTRIFFIIISNLKPQYSYIRIDNVNKNCIMKNMKQRSVVRSIEILSIISQSKLGMSLNDVVAKTKIPRTTTYDILQMLTESEMLQVIEGKTRQYKIGLKAFLIGNRYIQNMDLIQAARPVVDETSEKLEMTSFIAMLEGNQIIYLYKKEPENVPIYTANVSNREDVYCTSLGKAILSALPEEEVETMIPTLKFRQRTKNTIMNGETLKSDLALTRKRGFSLDDREILDFVFCVGAPIFDHSGRVAGGISVAGLYGPDRDAETEGKVLIDAANTISRRLGYTKGDN